MRQKITAWFLAAFAVFALAVSSAAPAFADRGGRGEGKGERGKSEIRIKGDEVRLRTREDANRNRDRDEDEDFDIEEARGQDAESLRILPGGLVRITGGRLEAAVASGTDSFFVNVFGLRLGVKPAGARITGDAGMTASLSDFIAGDLLSIEGIFDRASASVMARKIVDHTLASRTSTAMNDRIRAILDQIRALQDQLRALRQGVADAIAPVISAITNSNITSNSANVRWTTDENATSKVYFAATSPLNLTTAQTVFDGSLTTSHSVSLTGLTASTTYRFIVESKDAAGNTARSTEQSLTTL